ncbi:MAG TPA: molybdopterin-synthase adenylyltransferase MoeB [Thermoanaerobaculia bacterium]|nr:molybdopterin-synthase adenylyltransferase MoeB [Thermoanaerobaculia bacterium]
MTLSASELRRYSRHILLPQIGQDGQDRLKQGSVLIVGAGGLGSPAALYLAAAGVGRIGLVDFDRVALSNLHRQILYTTADEGLSKLEVAATRLRAANEEIAIELHETELTSANALSIIKPYDLVLDGSDNFPTRYLVNDACVILGKPDIYGSVFRFDGQVSVFSASTGPCYRCLYPAPPPPDLIPSCAEGGVLGVLPGVIGVLQATEAIKLLAKIGKPLIGRLLLYDALHMEFRTIRIGKNHGCSVCGREPTIRELIDYQRFCEGAEPKVTDESLEITPTELHDRMSKRDALTVVDVREPDEWNLGHIEGARHIPLGQLIAQHNTLDRNQEIILYCRSGARSGRALQMLQQAGFTKLKNMVGGILRWSSEVDPSVQAE